MPVASCGLTTLDLIHYVDRIPGPDQKVQAASARLEFGGPAANAAFTAAALGVPCHLVTAIGDGPLSRIARTQLQDVGITVVDAAASPWDLPVSSVAVTGLGRSVISVNAGDPPDLRLEACLAGFDALLVDGHHLPLCLAMAHEAHALGVPVLLDGGSWKPGLERLLPLIDAAVVSADFAGHLPEIPVAVTHGAGPVEYRWRGGTGMIEVEPVPDADTLGAGDVFHGAWLVHVARHGLDDFPAGLRYATNVASASCAWPGAHEWARHCSSAGRDSGLPSQA
jgi:sugar/nucleoside kinase (ribokinase family)